MDFLAEQVPPSVDSLRCRLRFHLNELVESDAELHFKQQLILSRFFLDGARDEDLNGIPHEIYSRYKRALFAFYKPE